MAAKIDSWGWAVDGEAGAGGHACGFLRQYRELLPATP
jgi:hypothetical protein